MKRHNLECVCIHVLNKTALAENCNDGYFVCSGCRDLYEEQGKKALLENLRTVCRCCVKTPEIFQLTRNDLEELK